MSDSDLQAPSSSRKGGEREQVLWLPGFASSQTNPPSVIPEYFLLRMKQKKQRLRNRMRLYGRRLGTVLWSCKHHKIPKAFLGKAAYHRHEQACLVGPTKPH